MTRRSHVLGGFSIDAVRYPDGTYDVDRLGGNAFWAALGARLAGGTPSVHAVVGTDYPAEALTRLAALDVDVAGVVCRSDLPSTRVTFTYGEDGARTQPADPEMLRAVPQPDRSRFIDNTDRADLLLATLPSADDVPAVLTPDVEPGAWYLGLLPAQRLRELVGALHGRGDLLVDCPERDELRRDGPGVLREMLPLVDVFMPSTSDAAVFLPDAGPSELLDMFHAWGASAIVLKCGEAGAIVSVDGRRWHVPVFRDPGEFDATGAGDVFGGGCVAATAAGADLVTAAVAGAAAASFATAARNPLDLAGIRPEDYELRRQLIASTVEAA